MNVFDLRDSLISGYGDYVRSFVSIKDPSIEAFVERELSSGVLWPPPLVQLNPSFAPGAWIDELVERGTLHSACSGIFRAGKGPEDQTGRGMRLHRHQVEAIETAKTGESYVLTTGTGSGKSLAYIVPVVDWVLRHGSGKGVQAIVVYPMNALANSQLGELDKFLDPLGSGRPLVRYARYTGQDDEERRRQIIADPPDIILTNYVMLELMLTRPEESKLVSAAAGLRFLVFDELHTYRGRQGADVAMLIRRLRDLVGGDGLQCVGTSATLAGPGSWEEQQSEVAALATRVFGTPVKPESVIGETLRRVTQPLTDSVRQALSASVSTAPPAQYDEFVKYPLAAWCEEVLGLREDRGRLVRQEPRAVLDPDNRSGGVIPSAAQQLAEQTGLDELACAGALQRTLLAGYEIRQPETGAPAFAFRLHQFISRGDTVYSSLETSSARHLTMTRQQFVPGDRSRRLLPLVFCRECGHEYFCVHVETDPATSSKRLAPRELSDLSREDGLREPTFLYLSRDNPWPEPGSVEELERLPDDWIEHGPRGARVRSSRRGDLPTTIHVDPLGELGGGIQGQLVRAPFRFCLSCGVSYSTRQRKDFGKLATLATEGRSTATSVLVLRALGELRRSDLPTTARKLLSFTDNRQDASLQAGHFNDFVEVSRLRGALAAAVEAAGREGLGHDQIGRAAVDALNLPFEAFAADPTLRGPARHQAESALREVVTYRLYRDFERGWRIVAPNLEQCDLVRIDYLGLAEAANDLEIWQGSHQALVEASPEQRMTVGRVLLDHMRRELAISVEALDPLAQEGLRQRASQRLREPWTLLDGELLTTAKRLIPASRGSEDQSYDTIFLSGLSGFGQYLRRPGVLPPPSTPLRPADAEAIIRQLLEVLRRYGCVTRLDVVDPEVPGQWQLAAASLKWLPGRGETVPIDPVRVPRGASSPRSPNPFFVAFYREAAATLVGFEAREHTAQVPALEREKREDRFRAAQLPVLFCSPTMELGVDISELNVVNMRNVPPTPANYAQRSGRAGRSGQPALVFTYCASGNSHDQYFYRRPRLMVAGAVAPPRIDLANEDLLRAHIQAVWLRECKKGLGTKLPDILDLDGEPPGLALSDSMAAAFEDDHAIARARSRGRRILATLEPELAATSWYGPTWLEDVLTRLRSTFEASCERWRSLYRSAYQQAEQQGRIILSNTSTSEQVKVARQLRAQAESQLGLLRGDQASIHSDFYSYRYFASEGFLPGYNFPRLPLAAFIPARGSAKHNDDEFISRPRFLAISEFGPRAIVYHDGSKYVTHRVILPVRDDEGAITTVAKLCDSCGYLHHGDDADLCDLCSEPLTSMRKNLFRMQNVTTRRRERINSDEEERYRLGYEVHSAFRFEARGHAASHRRADIIGPDDQPIADLRYADSANIWRYNLGWVRRARTDADGFVLDLQSGTWGTNKDLEAAGEDSEAALSKNVAKVVPFVEDHRNAIVLRPKETLDPGLLASLDAALRKALQATYQLEDSELSSERLPRRDQPRQLLLYESSEGGAGVLRRLVDDPDALPLVARKALELCHFDPDTGEDRRRAPHAHEDCEAGCYDCLLSYQNQLDHDLIDRHAVKPLLQALASARLVASPTALSRMDHLARLRRLCDSELERSFLDLLESHGLALPPEAQKPVEGAAARPDFLYPGLAVFIDGPHHDHADIAERDLAAERRLEDLGLAVLRLRFDDRKQWLERLRSYPSTFGVTRS